MLNFGKILSVCTFLITVNTFAHSDHSKHDWRADKEAFRSTKVDTKNYLNLPLLEGSLVPITIQESG